MFAPAPPPCPRHARPPLGRAAAAVAALLSGTALAQSGPWSIAASVAAAHESNLLRLADGQAPAADESRSDVVLSTAVVGGLNQTIGRQRVLGGLTLRDNRFDRNSKYDNQSYNGSLGLEWSSAERVSGTLALAATRSLSVFNAEGVGQLGARNLESARSANASLSVGLVTQFSLDLGGGQRRVRNSLPDNRVRSRDFNQDSAFLGLAWRPSPDLSLSTALRELHGEFPHLRTTAAGAESDRFKQQQLELAGTLKPSGASQLQARLNFVDTRYLVNAERDFDSVNGLLAWGWQASGKLHIGTRWSRDTGQDAYPSTAPGFFQGLPISPAVPVTLNDSRVITTWRVQADFEASAKLAFTASAQVARRTTRRTITVPAPFDALPPQHGRDRTTLVTLGARWAPLRHAMLGCDALHEQRRASGNLTDGLQGTSLTCFAQITLQ